MHAHTPARTHARTLARTRTRTRTHANDACAVEVLATSSIVCVNKYIALCIIANLLHCYGVTSAHLHSALRKANANGKLFSRKDIWVRCSFKCLFHLVKLVCRERCPGNHQNAVIRFLRCSTVPCITSYYKINAYFQLPMTNQPAKERRIF